MAYEGFQLLTYEYEKVKNPKKIFVPTIVSAVIFVIITYIIVTLGAAMLGGAFDLVQYKEIALSIAAKKQLGTTGLVVMTVAAGFATTAAINSTLYSPPPRCRTTLRKKGELPGWFRHKNKNDIPDRSVILIGCLAGLLAVLGSLSSLVEAASLVFLITFSTVNFLAWKKLKKRRWIPMVGIVVAGLIGLALLFRLIVTKPAALGGLIFIALLVILGRPFLLKLMSSGK